MTHTTRYTLTAAVETWAGGGDDAAVREASGRAYERHQHCGLRGAPKLFAKN